MDTLEITVKKCVCLAAVVLLVLAMSVSQAQESKKSGAGPEKVRGLEFTDQVELAEINCAWTVFRANKGKQAARDDWWIDDAKWKVALEKNGEGKKEPVDFSLWLPDGVEFVKGLVVMSGHGSGTSLYVNEELRKMAAELRLGLVKFIGNPMQRGFWPPSLLYDQLKKFAQISKHPEVEHAPFFLYGHSNGTGFSAIFPASEPGRVWGWISMRPGAKMQVYQPKAATVPGMVMFGEVDSYFARPSRQENVALIEKLRKDHSSLVHMVVEPGGGHGPSPRAWELVFAFLRESFAERVPTDCDPRQGPVKLKPLAVEGGYLGQNWNVAQAGKQDLPTAPYKEFSGDKSAASWLLNAAYAAEWKAFQRDWEFKEKK